MTIEPGASPAHLLPRSIRGAIEVVADARSRRICRCALRADSHADFRQWFHFRLQGARGQRVRIRFVNAGDGHLRRRLARLPGGGVVRSRRLVSRAHDVRGRRARDRAHAVARQHLLRVFRAVFVGAAPGAAGPRRCVAARPRARPGRDGRGPRHEPRRPWARRRAGRKSIWVIARQHPGETMAEWFVEGMLERLLDPADPVARRLLERAVVHVVPNMNPDGSVRGNLRTNAAGANLNREWQAPSRERSPEVFHVRAAMQATGVDAFLDMHGDEGLPYVFIDGNERLPSYSPRMAALERGFCGRAQARRIRTSRPCTAIRPTRKRRSTSPWPRSGWATPTAGSR